MIRNKLLMGVASGVMMVSLAACNNNNDNDTAFNNGRDNRYGTLNAGNYNVNRTMQDGSIAGGPTFYDVNDYRNGNDRLDRNNDDNRTARINNNNRNNRITRNTDDRFDGLEISADKTTISSKSFPHTKAVLIQEAKYKYVTTGPEKGNRGRKGNPQTQQAIPVPQQRGQGQIVIPQFNLAIPVPRPGAQPAPAPTAPTPAAPAPSPAAPAPAAPAPTKAPAPAQKPAPQATQGVSQAQARVIELTNVQRRQNGLPDLKADTQLNSVAQKKSVDMKQNNYFSHTSPTYGSPFDMMRDHGVSYKSAGENIAQGQQTPEQVVDSWMKSQGHRENILSPKYTHIGVGYEASGHHWTQMFIGK